MALDPVINFGKVTVSGFYDQNAYSITVSDGTRFPDPGVVGDYNITWYNDTDYPDPADDPNREIDRVIAVAGNVITLAYSGSSRIAQETSAGAPAASTKNTAGKTYKMILGITAKMITDIAAMLGTFQTFYLATVSGTIDDSNVNFVFAQLPSAIIINGNWTFQNNGWTWNSGTLTATLNGPVGQGGSLQAIK